MDVIKRDKSRVPFDASKIEKAKKEAEKSKRDSKSSIIKGFRDFTQKK